MLQKPMWCVGEIEDSVTFLVSYAPMMWRWLKVCYIPAETAGIFARVASAIPHVLKHAILVFYLPRCRRFAENHSGSELCVILKIAGQLRLSLSTFAHKHCKTPYNRQQVHATLRESTAVSLQQRRNQVCSNSFLWWIFGLFPVILLRCAFSLT